MSKLHSFDCFRTFHGDLPANSSDTDLAASSSSSSSAIQVSGRHHQDGHQQPHNRQHLSAPVDVVRPYHWRNCGEERGKKEGNVLRRRRIKEAAAEAEDEEEEEEGEGEEDEQAALKEEEEERLPPHEELAREWAAATSFGGAAFSLCQGAGRTLKGRDLCRVRNAILKQTGFIS